MKAIETIYKGYRFRSRLEARWAVFFDELGWDWVYEPEGFELPSGRYLPDFYFPDVKSYAEVKPETFSEVELKKCLELSKKTYTNILGDTACHEIFLLEGPPDMKSYRMVCDGELLSNIIFCPVGDKYYPVYYAHDFDPLYFTDTAEAVLTSRSARFEFGESGTK